MTLAAALAQTHPKCTVPAIIDAVADVCGVPANVILGRSRPARVSAARHLVMYLTRKHTCLSLAEIGTQVGGRDHGTVMNSVAIVGRELAAERTSKTQPLAAIVAHVEARLKDKIYLP